MEPEKDQALWRLAKKRVQFKRHLAAYIIVNSFLWAVWIFSPKEQDEAQYPWPLMSMLGWGIGLAFHFMGTFVFENSNAVEKEYEKLKSKD
jgi:hypothetical protein